MTRQNPLIPPPLPPVEPSYWNGERLMILRYRLRWGQDDLANYLQVGRSTVSEWERTNGQPLAIYRRMLDKLWEQVAELQDQQSIDGV